MKNIKQMDNVEFVKHIMQTGSPMNQLFVLDSLIKWADYIVKHEKEVLKQLDNTMIYGPAWVEAAKHVQKMFELRNQK